MGGHLDLESLGGSGVRTYNPSGIILSGNAGREDSEERCVGIPLYVGYTFYVPDKPYTKPTLHRKNFGGHAYPLPS